MCKHVDSPTYILAKGDSAAGHHYWRESDMKCFTDLIKNTNSIILPNTTEIEPAQQGTLPLEKEL